MCLTKKKKEHKKWKLYKFIAKHNHNRMSYPRKYKKTEGFPMFSGDMHKSKVNHKSVKCNKKHPLSIGAAHNKNIALKEI